MMMAPSGGEGGSGAGPSQRPGHIDLTLPPGSGDELSDLVAELDQAEREIRRLSESRIESTEDQEARQQILARLKTFLDEVDSRLEQAREIDRVRDNERARLREELDAQMVPFLLFREFRRPSSQLKGGRKPSKFERCLVNKSRPKNNIENCGPRNRKGGPGARASWVGV